MSKYLVKKSGDYWVAKDEVMSDAEAEGSMLLFFLFIMSPALIAPGYAVYMTWETMRHTCNLHPLLTFLLCTAEVCIFWKIIEEFFEEAPRASCGLICGAAAAAGYGYLVSLITSDPVWIGAVAIATFLVGRGIGICCSDDNKRKHKKVPAAA